MLRLKAKHHVLTFGHVFLISCLVLFYKRAAIFFRASTGSTVTVWAPTDSKQSISTILFSYPSARRPSFLSYVHGPEYFYSWHTLSAWLYMQFTEAESGSVVMEISCDEEDSGHWLVGSVITNKAVHGDSICHIFRSVWKSKTVSEIRELRPNLFLIKSVNEEAKNMILKWRPWVVHKDLFSIELYNPAWRATNFNFNNMVIWVCVYQLPLRAMNDAMRLQLGVVSGRRLVLTTGAGNRLYVLSNMSGCLTFVIFVACLGTILLRNEPPQSHDNTPSHVTPIPSSTNQLVNHVSAVPTQVVEDSAIVADSLATIPVARTPKRTIQDSKTETKTGMSSLNSPTEVAEVPWQPQQAS
ncbi:hypothetical protein V6N11_054593 [Hibiscus sabdariffa]|uniref:DUF4283 domain-containing protein n=1 Tax=Hibiscus sabdariffa TaxID=183260 RepID=A0ABR2S4H8_9ROSI